MGLSLNPLGLSLIGRRPGAGGGGGGESAPWTPLTESNLGDFWDYNDLSNGAVASWTSQKLSFPQVLTQATGANQPIRSAAGVTFDGVNDKLATPVVAPAFIQYTAMPDIPGHSYEPGRGFSNGGITKAPDGSFWVTNGGRSPFAAESTRRPALVHLACDAGGHMTDTVLHVVDLYTLCDGDGSDTVSLTSKIAPWGVCYDETDDTLWTAYGNGVDPARLEHILDPTGTPSRGADGFELTVGVRSTARYEALDAIWVYDFDDQKLRLFDCSDASLIEERAYFAGALGDHIYYLQDDNIIMYFAGDNDGPAWIGLRNLENNVDLFTVELPEMYGGIEQGYYDLARRRLFVNSNAWLHQVPTGPQINRTLEFEVPVYWARSIDLFAVFKVPVILGNSDFLFGTDHISRPGFSVRVTNAGVLNLTLHQHTGPLETSVERLVAEFTVPSVSAIYRILYARYTPGDSITLWIDGTLIGTQADANTNGILKNQPIRISQGNTDIECSTVVAKMLGYYNGTVTTDVRQKTEGWLAHGNGLAVNLPVDHPYKINLDATAPEEFADTDWAVTNARTGNRIVIAINELPGDGGSPITGVDYQLDGGAWVNLVTVPLDTPIPLVNYPITGLTNDQLYSVRVRASNIAGSSAESSAKTVTPDASVPTISITSGPGYVGSTYSAVFGGSPNAAQWTSDGVDIPGETGTTFVMTAEYEGTQIQQDESNIVEMWVPSDLGVLLVEQMDAYRGITLNGGDVASWQDQINGYLAEQSTAGQQPLYDATSSVMGSRPAVVFTAANSDRMTFAASGSSQTQPLVRAAVAYTASTGTQRAICEGQANGNRGGLYQTAGNKAAVYAGSTLIASAASVSVNTPYITYGHIDGASSFHRLNGTQSASGNAGGHASRLGTIGSNSNSGDFWNGGVSEILSMNDVTGYEEIIEGYLAHRWGLTGSLPSGHTYKTDPPTIAH